MSAGRLKVRLAKAAELAVRQGHPWVFAGSIRGQNRPIVNGEIGVIYDRQDRPMALALCEEGSPIPMRVVHLGAGRQIDAAWWQEKLQQAVARRAGILDGATDACRLVHGENDGFPGLVVDRYASCLVVKLYTAAWFPRLEEMLGMLRALPGITSVMLRLARHAQAAARAAGLPLAEGWLHGAVELPVIFQENGIRFEADVLHGQKTGFFLDQRENRQQVAGLARGRRVLNAFSYSGGFSLQAARGGAASVTDLDMSPQALDSSRRNFALNPSLARCPRQTILADAFAWMEEGPRAEFDLIVTDPPSLAKREAEKPAALSRYQRLNAAALARLPRGGILVACSCSAHVTPEEFASNTLGAGKRSGRRFRELWRSGNPEDHPSTFPEARYLKAMALELL